MKIIPPRTDETGPGSACAPSGHHSRQKSQSYKAHPPCDPFPTPPTADSKGECPLPCAKKVGGSPHRFNEQNCAQITSFAQYFTSQTSREICAQITRFAQYFTSLTSRGIISH